MLRVNKNHIHNTQKLKFVSNKITKILLTVLDFQLVFSHPQSVCVTFLVVVNPAVEFPESGQSSRPHPNDEVFVLEAVVVGIFGIELVDGLLPGYRLGEILEDLPQVVAGRIAKFDVLVGGPGDVRVQKRHLLSGFVLVRYRPYREAVCKSTKRNNGIRNVLWLFLPLKREFAMAPQGAIGIILPLESLAVAKGSQSDEGVKLNLPSNWLSSLDFTYLL